MNTQPIDSLGFTAGVRGLGDLLWWAAMSITYSNRDPSSGLIILEYTSHNGVFCTRTERTRRSYVQGSCKW